MPQDRYVRDKFTKTHNAARDAAKDYFRRFPKDLYETEVESWQQIQSSNIEFTMKRLREPKSPGSDIEVVTKKYFAEHGRFPAGRRFWKFILQTDRVTEKDHWLNLDDKPRTYPDALEEAKRIAALRKSVRIVVEP